MMEVTVASRCKLLLKHVEEYIEYIVHRREESK